MPIVWRTTCSYKSWVPMKLKILSFNIHKGFDWKNTVYTLDSMKDFIASTNADIVLLQEVVGKNEKYKEKGMIDKQFEYFADALWPHFSYAQNALYEHGHHGNLILSKYPIESWENINLSTNPFEQRGMLICKISLPHLQHKKFYAACLHLDLLHKGRSKQYEKIKKYLHDKNSDEDDPSLIIAGDFNDWNMRASDTFETHLGMYEAHKYTHGSYAKTFPAGFPFLKLDRIYVKNMNVVKAEAIGLGNNGLSDHLPLFCEVEVHDS